MGKVYCNKCTYLRRNPFNFNILSCGRKYGAPYIVEDPIEGEIEKVNPLDSLHPTRRNSNFDCKYFKPTLLRRVLKRLFSSAFK